MRIGLVVGTLSLTRVHASLAGKRWVIAQPQNLEALQRAAAAPHPNPSPEAGGGSQEEVVVLDELGASPGGRIAFSEGGEAAAPFHPAKKPVDAYVACLLDELTLREAAAATVAAGA